MIDSWNIFRLQSAPLLAEAYLPHWGEQMGLAMILLLCAAFVVQGIWNGLMAEFPQIGRISYFRAMHIASIGGLILFVMLYLFF